MHTDDTNDVIAFVVVQDMSRIIQLKPFCFEVVRLDIRISDFPRPQCDRAQRVGFEDKVVRELFATART